MLSTVSTLLAVADLTEVNPGLTFWTLVTFVVVGLLLRQVAWDPILKLVEDREKAIVDAIESSKKERAEAERLLADQKTAIADARREAAQMIQQNKEEVSKLREDLLSKSRAEAEELLSQARRQIAEEKQKALTEVRTQVVDLALQAAAKIINSSLDEAKQKALVQDYLDKMPKQRN